MRKSNYKGKICVFLCALLCVVSLSGCSTVMQSLADGTDAVLSGLTDGTDIVLNGLADGTNQALDALSEADDGQAKNSILEAFGKFVDDAGTAALTPQSKLQGHKKNGADDTRGPMKQRIPILQVQRFCLVVLPWSAKREVHSTSPVLFLSKVARQRFFFAQVQMIRPFFSRRAVSTMAQLKWMAQALISECGATRRTEPYPLRLNKEYSL